MRILTDRGTEYCGAREHHEYQLYLTIEDIDHTRTKAKSPQTNGICERFHKTVQQEFFWVAFRKKIYTSLSELQTDLDNWLKFYNSERTHTGRYCYGKTPMQTFLDTIELAKDKLIEYTGDIFSSETTSQNQEGGLEEKLCEGNGVEEFSNLENEKV